jgi:hypothetical protein
MNVFLRLCTATVAAMLLVAQAHAVGLAEISNKDATAGLKEALIKGSQAAVAALGK